MPVYVDVTIKTTSHEEDPEKVEEGWLMVEARAPGRDPGYFYVRIEQFESLTGRAYAEQYVRDRGGLPS